MNIALVALRQSRVVGRALRCPPSGICRGTGVALPSCGGQGTARPAFPSPIMTGALPPEIELSQL